MTVWKSYLGDGVYVDIGVIKGEIILTVEDGVNVLERVVLEPAVHRALTDWMKRILEATEGVLDGPSDE